MFPHRSRTEPYKTSRCYFPAVSHLLALRRSVRASACRHRLRACKGIHLHRPWPGPRALTRMLIARSHAQRRDWSQPRAAPTPSAQQLRWARPHQATGLWARTRARRQPSGRTPAIDVARLIARHPPAFLRRLHPETTRRRSREPRDHAAPSDRRITTRRRLAGGIRQPRDERHSVRGAISARVPPSSPSRHARATHNSPAPHTPLRTHNTQAHTSRCTSRGNRARARRSTPRSTSSPTSSSPGTRKGHEPATRRC